MHLSEDVYGKLINIAGRQRMLSQRIGFLFLTLSGQLESGKQVQESLWSMQEKALDDFEAGYRLLTHGDADAGIPKLTSQRITAVLEGDGSASGKTSVERFLREARDHMRALSKGEMPRTAVFERFSEFVLVDLLKTLQAVVTALEEDFSEEMQRRRTKREEDAARVKSALEEIQKASKFSRMIALNAKISADRAGPYGKEFGALTEELKNISSAITESSEDIMRHLDGL